MIFTYRCLKDDREIITHTFCPAVFCKECMDEMILMEVNHTNIQNIRDELQVLNLEIL